MIKSSKKAGGKSAGIKVLIRGIAMSFLDLKKSMTESHYLFRIETSVNV